MSCFDLSRRTKGNLFSALASGEVRLISVATLRHDLAGIDAKSG
jgi:hypothetical protein